MAANSAKSVKNVQFHEEAIRNKQRGGEEEFEAYSVYVDNVDYRCTVEELKTHFKSCGTVNRVTIPTNQFGNPRGYGFVEFSEVDSVGKALLQLNGSVLRSREITVSRAKRNRRNWNPNNNTSRGFRPPLQQQLPRNSRSVSANPNRPPYSNTNNRPVPSSSNLRFSYVRAAADDENRDNNIEEAAIPIEQGGGEGVEFDKYTVYVDNVDYWCTAQDLRTHFEASCGRVNRINIPTNEFGNPQGYAFVEFSDLGIVDKALKLNGSILRSREITVSRKRQNPNKNNRGPGFGGPAQQQQPSANFRNVGGHYNRSSRPPYPNTNTNRSVQPQPQKPDSSSSSFVGEIGDPNTNTNRSVQPQPQKPDSSSSSFVGEIGDPNTNTNRSVQPQPQKPESSSSSAGEIGDPNTNTDISVQPQPQKPDSSSSFFFVGKIAVSTSTSAPANIENINNDNQAAQRPTAPHSSSQQSLTQ